MTAKQLYEYIHVELNNTNSPNILLEDFNYLVNKAINLFVNKRYNIYDVNQQTTDDLGVLKANSILTPIRITNYDSLSLVNDGMAVYYVDLPSDYLHLLNCICVYNVNKTYKCYNKGDTWRASATRLTADMYSLVLDNFWTLPTYRNPYYYIHNINTSVNNPTLPYNSNTKVGTDVSGVTTTSGNIDGNGNLIGKESGGLPKTIDIGGTTISNVEKVAQVRYGNVSKVRLEIRYGTDTSVFALSKVYIDYLKAPQYIRLTQQLLDKTEDISQMLEFPEYVCQEILNELVHIIMENQLNLRLQTHPVVSLSIANPTQQLTQENQ